MPIHKAAYINPSAQIYGQVDLGTGASLWANVVARAESQSIKVGALSNIQDFVMMHVGDETPTVIGDFCSITHHVTVHGATIEDECLIGIGAVIMDGARIGRGSIVAGGSFVTEGSEFPANSIIMGSPAKVRKERDSSKANRFNAWMYYRNALCYAQGDHRGWTGPQFEQWAEAKKQAIAVDADYEELRLLS